MKRNALALGASVIALALMAGPAAAEPGLGQTVDDSTGALQVGAVAVDAPVRVASDGDSATPGVSAAGPQTTEDSTGAAQVGAVDADVPVRVLSDGDDAEPAPSVAGEQSTGDSLGAAQVGTVDVAAPVRVASDGDNASAAGADGGSTAGRQTVSDSLGAAQVGAVDADVPVRVLSDGDDAEPAPSAAGEQSTGDSLGSAQVGAVDVAAPVRVASDGDNASAGGAEGGSTAGRQTVSDSSGAAQVGAPRLFAPVRILSGGGTPDTVDELVGELLGSPSGGDDVVGTPSAVGPTAGDAPQGRDWPSSDELRSLVDGPHRDAPFRFASGGVGDAPGYAQALGVSAASLPLTGAGVMTPALLGVWLLASGLGLRLVPGGRRR